MKVLVTTKLSPHKYKTPEGYLYCQDAIIARTGKQTYIKSEVFPDSNSDELIDIDRPIEEVTNPLTLASFEDKPITCEHPDENVGPHNYNELAVGHIKNVRVGSEKIDNETVILADLIITDEQIIADIENGERTDLSCGYDCDITDGPNYKQVNIRGNHVALCEQGRAGCARIVDSVVKDSKDDDFKKLISEEEDAIKSYQAAIEHAKRRGDTKAVELLEHIMKEEIEHKAELEMNAKIADWNVAKLLKDADSLNIKYKCNNRTLLDSDYSFIGSKVAINRLKELNNKKLLNVQEKVIKKPIVKDSLSKGTLIQEFGKNGSQYKIIKIEKNTVYAEDIINNKLTLFRKDKEGIDWAVINKSDIKDSMPNISMEADNIINLLKEKNVNADITTSYAAITIKFENVHDLNKIFKILKDIYDCEKTTDNLTINIYDKIKQKVNDRVVKINKSFNDNLSYSRKFYVKALDKLQRKLDALEKNKTLDGFNNEYEHQKNRYKEQLKTQIEKYKKVIEELDKTEDN